VLLLSLNTSKTMHRHLQNPRRHIDYQIFAAPVNMHGHIQSIRCFQCNLTHYSITCQQFSIMAAQVKLCQHIQHLPMFSNLYRRITT
jgi:hypothetical protein